MLPMMSGVLDLDTLMLDEVTNCGMIFKEYMIRLQLFDTWHPKCRCLVYFDDLTNHPEVFIPQVMSFIGDDAEHHSHIAHYSEFKKALLERYNTKGNRTGSGQDQTFFSRKISPEILNIVDEHIQTHYPTLWYRYLKVFAEKTKSYESFPK